METRRDFLISCAKLAFVLPLIAVADCTKKKPEPEKNLLSEDDPTAKIFKYVKDGTTGTFPKLNKEVPSEEQICKNCNFYKAIGDDYGNCSTLKGNVTSIGYCTSWAKKLPTASAAPSS